MFGNHGLCGLLEEGAHGKSPKCLDGNLGDFGEFCKGLGLQKYQLRRVFIYSRGQSPRYGCRLQIPASRLKKTVPTSLPAAPSFPRRRESRPLIFRNIQRLPQYGLCPRMRFAEILVSTGRLCFTGETRHIFRRRF